MDLVLDANILFAACIKNGVTVDVLVHEHIHLFAPEFIFTEFLKYQTLLLEKTERTLEEFNAFLEVVRSRVVLIPLEELVPFLSEAEKISPDDKDVAYVALALKCSIDIWSNDKPLKEKQDIVKVYSTHELLCLLNN